VKPRRKEFYPDYFLEILVVIFLTVELVALLSLIFPTEIGRRIDFSLPFRPKPEWYFLWIYELIRYFPGRWTVIGSILLPASALLLLAAIPFIDRGRRGRALALAFGIIFAAGVIILTIMGSISP
jgi:cytochrome b6-f complex subunit 4